MASVKSIRKEINEMWVLVNAQIAKSCNAAADFDKDLAREIVVIEERVNAYEYLIDHHCQVFRVLHPDRNEELPFLMIVLKTNRYLERIGDITADIANEIINTTRSHSKKILRYTELLGAFRTIIKMFDVAFTAFKGNDIELARLVLKRSNYLELNNTDIKAKIKMYIKGNPNEIESAVHLLSVVNHLDRLIEQANSLAMGIITYIDAGFREPALSGE